MESSIPKQQICTHLGLVNDPTTLYSFPAVTHRCYAASPPAEIAAGHQSLYCLRQGHTDCPVYRGEEVAAGRPIGDEDTREPRQKWRRYPVILIFGLGGLLLLAGVVVVVLSVDFSRNPSGSSFTSIPSSTPMTPDAASTEPETSSVSGIPSQTATITPILTEIVSTEIPQPTISPSPEIDTPVGPFNLIVHVVSAGDALSSLATQYDTNVDVLMVANGLTEGDIIQVGQSLVIPVGIQSTAEMPAFAIYQTPQDLTLADIAAVFNAVPEEIRQVNALGPSNVIPAGRILFIPLPPTEEQTPSAP